VGAEDEPQCKLVCFENPVSSADLNDLVEPFADPHKQGVNGQARGRGRDEIE
jgi:hypothetical protein